MDVDEVNNDSTFDLSQDGGDGYPESSLASNPDGLEPLELGHNDGGDTHKNEELTTTLTLDSLHQTMLEFQQQIDTQKEEIRALRLSDAAKTEKIELQRKQLQALAQCLIHHSPLLSGVAGTGSKERRASVSSSSSRTGTKLNKRTASHQALDELKVEEASIASEEDVSVHPEKWATTLQSPKSASASEVSVNPPEEKEKPVVPPQPKKKPPAKPRKPAVPRKPRVEAVRPKPSSPRGPMSEYKQRALRRYRGVLRSLGVQLETDPVLDAEEMPPATPTPLSQHDSQPSYLMGGNMFPTFPGVSLSSSSPIQPRLDSGGIFFPQHMATSQSLSSSSTGHQIPQDSPVRQIGFNRTALLNLGSIGVFHTPAAASIPMPHLQAGASDPAAQLRRPPLPVRPEAEHTAASSMSFTTDQQTQQRLHELFPHGSHPMAFPNDRPQGTHNPPGRT